MTDITDETQNERCPYAVWNRDWQEFNCEYKWDCIDKVLVDRDNNVAICERTAIKSFEEFLRIEAVCRQADIETIARRVEVAARTGF